MFVSGLITNNNNLLTLAFTQIIIIIQAHYEIKALMYLSSPFTFESTVNLFMGKTVERNGEWMYNMTEPSNQGMKLSL